MNILVAMDSSASAYAALAAALAREWTEGTSFRILTVLPRRASRSVDAEVIGSDVNRAHRLIDRATSELEARNPDSIVIGQIDVGDPAKNIVRLADSWPADLIIIGPHDRGLVGRFFIGSVSKAVLKQAGCSVLVAREPGEVVKTNNILVAVDDSAGSQAMVDSILQSAWPKTTRFYLLTAATPNQALYGYQPSAVSNLYALDRHEEYLRSLYEMVQGIAQRFERAFGPESVDYSVIEGEPEQVILETAKSLSVHLIMLGSIGRPDLKRKLMGSICQAVALKAHCSVQVMRSNVLPLGSRMPTFGSSRGLRPVSGL